MIQDIFPMVFHNEYRAFEPNDESLIISFQEDKMLIRQEAGVSRFPQYQEVSFSGGEIHYLFSIDDQKYFLLMASESIAIEGYEYVPVGSFREMQPRHTAFAAVTAYHLCRWYESNRFCGRCGHTMTADDKERMLRCPACENIIYPVIAPAVIIGVVDGDRIIMTKYNSREYKRYALVAGFAEIGESLEQTVAREVMEEVGLRVKNIRYYKSQPWALSGTLLAGFFAELDGDDEIIMDEEELSEAVWFHRDEITIQDDTISLTREMIAAFQSGLFNSDFFRK